MYFILYSSFFIFRYVRAMVCTIRQRNTIFFLASTIFLILALIYIYINWNDRVTFKSIAQNPVEQQSSSWNSKLTKKGVAQNPVWKSIPSFEMNIRMSYDPQRLYDNYVRWFLKSYRLFWPRELNNLTIVLNNELRGDHLMGKKLASLWPYPRIAFLDPPSSDAIGNNDVSERFRMYYDGFFPDKYTTAEYVGFSDTDTMFTTVVTPESLFKNGRAIVVGYIGRSDFCFPQGTEFLLKQKSVMNMAYFPVTIKVAHLVEMRKYIEKIHGESFPKLFYKTVFFKKGTGVDTSCSCQFCVMLNYIWYHHRDDYEFHLQMYPNGAWNGPIRAGQVSLDYLRAIDREYKVPVVRVSTHARYVNVDGKIHSKIDSMIDPYATWLDKTIKEGICYSIGFEMCPNLCTQFSREKPHASLFSFETFNWLWEKEWCAREQAKHYANVHNYLRWGYKGKYFGFFDSLEEVCTLL